MGKSTSAASAKPQTPEEAADQASRIPQKKPLPLSQRTAIWKYRLVLAWAIIGCVIVAAGVLWGLGQVASALVSLAIAFFLWYILKGIVDALDRKGVPRILGAAVAFIVFALVWVALSLLVFPVIGNQISELIKNFPSYIDQAVAWVSDLGEQYKALEPSSQIKQLIDSAGKQIVSWVSSIATTSGTAIITGATSAVNFIVSIFMSFILAFWLLKDGKRMGKEIRVLVSDRWMPDFDFFVDTTSKSVGGYIRGTLIASACTGALATIGFYAIGLPYALILGLLTAFLNIIPMIGPWIGGAIAAVVGLFISPLVAVLSIVITVVAQQLTDTFVSPRVMSKNVDIHPIMVIVALLVGGALFGIVGTIVSVPVLAICKSIFVYYFERKTGKTLATPDGALFPSGKETTKSQRKARSKVEAEERKIADKIKGEVKKIESDLGKKDKSEDAPSEKSKKEHE